MKIESFDPVRFIVSVFIVIAMFAGKIDIWTGLPLLGLCINLKLRRR